MTENHLTVSFGVAMDLNKKKLGFLSIAGGVNEFNTFAKSVAGADELWDINFQTAIKYLVGRYNHYALPLRLPVIPIRHSYSPSQQMLTQELYDRWPVQYIKATVLTFDTLHPFSNQQQFEE